MRADAGDDLDDRPAPGEPARDQQRNGEAGDGSGEGVREHRAVRQHVGGEHSHRAGRGRSRGKDQIGRHDHLRRLRRRPDVGERGGEILI